jgi:hypothetical protein
MTSMTQRPTPERLKEMQKFLEHADLNADNSARFWMEDLFLEIDALKADNETLKKALKEEQRSVAYLLLHPPHGTRKEANKSTD